MSVIPDGFVVQNGWDAIAVALGKAIDAEEAEHEQTYDQARDALSIEQSEVIRLFVKAADVLAATYKATEGSPQHEHMELCLEEKFKQDMSISHRRALGGIFNELDCYLFSPSDLKY